MKRRMSLLICLIGILFLPVTFANAAPKETGLESFPPTLIVSSYEITKGNIILGENFTLTLTIENTNPYIEANNIMFFYYVSESAMYPEFGSANQIFIDSMKGGDSKKIDLNMTVAETYNSDLAILNLDMKYLDHSGNDYSNTALITLPISKNCSMEIKTISVTDTSTLGSKSLVSVAYHNNGVADVKNPIMILSGDILEEQKRIQLSDLVSGEQGYKDCYVSFQKAGVQDLTISFEYEDEDGVKYFIEGEKFQSKVNAISSKQSNILPEESYTSQGMLLGFEQWQIIAMGTGVLLIIVLIALLYHRNRKGIG